jgi:hypothetical protein
MKIISFFTTQPIYFLKVIGGALLTLVCLVVAALVLIGLTRPSPGQSAPVTAILNIIEAPTSTSHSSETPTPSAFTTASPPPPSVGILVGAFVQVSGTGGGGLRLRSDPGLNSRINLLASEAEVFRADGGPLELDGYTWWYLVGPFDPTRNGWAVSNYLVVVQEP